MSAEFAVSTSVADEFPKDGLPEIAFVGRSNVGKSSLLNTLLLRRKRNGGPLALDRRQLARTSRTPGRTQQINFYRIDRAFYFVDLPGYGYAKASRQAVAGWRSLAEGYLRDRSSLRLVALVIDSRHGASKLDQLMKEWLIANKRRFVVIASKTDKLKSNERVPAIRSIEESFCPVVPFSAKTGKGVRPLWGEIRKALEH